MEWNEADNMKRYNPKHKIAKNCDNNQTATTTSRMLCLFGY